MREIKLRGKSAENGAWVYGYGFKAGEFNQNTTPVLQSTIGEFTTISDSEGKEIWEGDIIKTLTTGNIYEVKFGYCESMAFIGWYAVGKNTEAALGGRDLRNDKVTVIGNIYETPELIA